MQVNDIRSQIAGFVTSDSTLYLYYLLHHNDVDDYRRDTIESYCRFLLWFLLIGRKHYRYPIVIPNTIREIVALPDSDGRHLLMDFVLSVTYGPIADHYEARARYYYDALPRFGLGPFISCAEMKYFSSLKGLARRAESTVPKDRYLSAVGIHDLAGQLSGLARARPGVSLPSVSIVGFHRSTLGLGEDARSMFDCLLDVGLRPELIDASPPNLEPFDGASVYKPFETPYPNGSVVIFCMPVFEMMRLICTLGLTPAHRGQYWIGYWPWETSALGSGWERAFEFVDEVWASSSFLYGVYRKIAKKTVTHVPLNVHVPIPKEPDGIG